MINNYQHNKGVTSRFRKELRSMLDDISGIDKRCLEKAVNKGLASAKRNSPVITGFMRKSWSVTPTVSSLDGVEKTLMNSADYSEFVNYGHRVVNALEENTGWVPGQFMLEKAVRATERSLREEFKKEIERINREHNK